jgi:hypothetical protein
MQSVPHASNPFALLIDPAAVFAELERSDLNRIAGRVCRPLDKPLPAAPSDAATRATECPGGDEESFAD